MGSDEEYFIPIKVDDEFLRSVADMAKEVLNKNNILENIFQKNIRAYNMNLKEGCSAKTLQVMNQNNKQIFSSITPSEVIRSPRCSKISAIKDTKASVVFNSNHQVRTPNKISRINSNTGRKRMSFDEVEKENMDNLYAFTKTSDGNELMVTSSNMKDRTPVNFTVNERRNIRQLDKSPSLFSYEEEAEAFDKAETYLDERLSLEGKPETITSLSTYDEDTEYLLHNTLDQQEMLTRLEKKDKTSVNYSVNEERKYRDLEIKPSFFSSAVLAQNTQETFNLERKHENFTSFSIYVRDTAYQPKATPDKHETNVTVFEKRSITTVSDTVDGKSRDTHFEISPYFFSSGGEIKVYDKNKTNELESLLSDENPEAVSSMSVGHEETAYMLYKTPDKCQTIITSGEKEGRTPINDIEGKPVTVKTAPRNQEFISPKKDIKTYNNSAVNKRKSVNYYEGAVMTTYLGTKDQSFIGPPKMAKLDDELARDKNNVISATVSDMDDQQHFNAYDESAMEDISSNPIDESAVDDNIPSNPAEEPAMDDIPFNPIEEWDVDNSVILNPADVSAMDDVSSNTIDECIVDDNIHSNPVNVSATDDKDYFNCADNKSIMNYNIPPNPVDDVAMDDNDSLSRNDDRSIMKDMPTILNQNIDKYNFMSTSTGENSERAAYIAAYYQTSVTQNSASYLSPKGDLNITVEDNLDTSTPKKDKIRLQCNVAQETKDIESLTNLRQNLSPSVKRSFDGISQKPMPSGSVSDDETVERQLYLQYNLSKMNTSQRYCSVPNVSTPKQSEAADIAREFVDMFKQRKTRKRIYFHLFVEDLNDLRFICAYINRIIGIVKSIPSSYYNAELIEVVHRFMEKALKLLNKATSWQSEVENDLIVWKDCFEKFKQIKQELKHFCKEKPRKLTLIDFQAWETRLRTVNKKSDDMTLLREIRRPTFLQFGYELENFIQLFIRCIQVVRLLQSSSND